jgi:L-gulonolactone oxidase
MYRKSAATCHEAKYESRAVEAGRTGVFEQLPNSPCFEIPMSVEWRNDFHSWGRVVRRPQAVTTPMFRDQIPALLADRGKFATCLAVGLRRSYGDSCLNSEGLLIDMTRVDHFLMLDPKHRIVRAEAGASLAAVIALAVPSGLFLPTTPGTRYVTLGGAVANDVHGKNHHRAGTFGRHVSRIGLLRSDGQHYVLSQSEYPQLFRATIGGLGLTGIIEWVELMLTPIPGTQLDVEKIPFHSLKAFWDLAKTSVETHEHTVAWLDCAASGPAIGRGIFSRANWRLDGERTISSDRARIVIPCEMPAFLLNNWIIHVFNEFYFRRHRCISFVSPYSEFFYPLDSIEDWNRLYGGGGLYQYQCVVPTTTQQDAVEAIIRTLGDSQERPCLATLKTLGDLPSPGLLSFPHEGATVTLDFRNSGATTLALMERLDTIVREAGGRLYPAKDGRMSAAMFRCGYPELEHFAKYVDPICTSDFWQRVNG